LEAQIWLGELESFSAEARHEALLHFCARSLAVTPSRVALTFDAFGAPQLMLDGALGEWRVSSASRGKTALFGLARRKIGVDLELLGEPLEPAWNVLHPREQQALRALRPNERHAAFLQLWTAKEAYLKALGLGLRREPSEFWVRPQDGAYQIFDREGQVPTQRANAWREKVGADEALCACVVLTETAVS
jgi:4'-phosphopantetheinyl transferase